MVNDLDATLAALADPSRRAAIDLLREGPKRAGELAQRLGLSGPAASRHLRTLRRCRLVDVTLDPDDARARTYVLRPDRLNELAAWLEEVRVFWTGQLASFKQYAEHRAPQEASPDTRRDGRRSQRAKPKKRKPRRNRGAGE